MAKKGKKPVKRRRRRIGGAMALNPSSPMVMIGSALLGFFFGKTINPLIDKATGSLDTKIVAGAQVGLGAWYFLMSKSKKTLLPTVAIGVLAGAGVKRAFAAFGIGGYGGIPVLNGYGAIPALNGVGRKTIKGYTPQGTLTGYTPQGTLNGYMNPANVMGGTGSGDGTGSDLMREGSSSLMG